jgi:hypothetical protein
MYIYLLERFIYMPFEPFCNYTHSSRAMAWRTIFAAPYHRNKPIQAYASQLRSFIYKKCKHFLSKYTFFVMLLNQVPRFLEKSSVGEKYPLNNYLSSQPQLLLLLQLTTSITLAIF